MIKRMVLLMALLAAMSAGDAGAVEKYGVPVYPGAEYDEGTTRYLDDVQYIEGAAYRTTDDPSAVAEFYVKLGLTPVKGKAKATATFKKDDVEVAIQGPPRKEIASGKKVEDTLITITKEN
ncbi:MAG: hypothetical protein AABZ15_04110 [Nitrospirota bacterium]